MVEQVVSAFSADQVVQLTDLSKSQLSYWDTTGFFPPSHACGDRRTPYARIYSFHDVVGLRTLSLLRNRHKVPLSHLREVARVLSKYSETPWSSVRLKVWNRKVQFDEPETGKTRGVVDGQYTLLPILDVMEDMRREADKLRLRDPSRVGQIERRRFVAGNAPVIGGTRVPASTILHFIEDGFSPQDIVREYPSLTVEDVEAVIQQKDSLAA